MLRAEGIPYRHITSLLSVPHLSASTSFAAILQGTSTADVRLQDDARGTAGIANAAAWKAGDDYSLQQPGMAAPASRRAKTILGQSLSLRAQPFASMPAWDHESGGNVKISLDICPMELARAGVAVIQLLETDNCLA